MANPIITTGTTSDPISTEHNSGESIYDWVTRHDNEVDDSIPSGDILKTTWTSASGSCETTTTRNKGESNTAFVDRHVQECVTAMNANEPIP